MTQDRRSIESRRPRLRTSALFLRDSKNEATSLHTQIRVAFESIYFCCVEIAASTGMPVETLEHPSYEIVDVALTSLDVPIEDRLAVELLVTWTESSTPFLPAMSVSEVRDVAARIFTATIERFA